MESLIVGMLEQLGISSVVGGLLYVIVSREAHHRKEKRDGQINELKEENKDIKDKWKEHKAYHNSFEKDIHEKLNSALIILHTLKGYMDGKNDKSK